MSHTGQFFFAEDLAEKIAAMSPYKDSTVERVKLNDDFIYQQADSGLLTIRPVHKGRIERGVLANHHGRHQPDSHTGGELTR